MSASITPYIKFLILVLLGGLATITFASFVLGLGGQGLPAGAPEVHAVRNFLAWGGSRARGSREGDVIWELSAEDYLIDLLEVCA